MLSFIIATAQQETLNDSKYMFAKKVFKKEYKKQKYRPFNDIITVIDSNTVKYNNKTLSLFGVPDSYKMVFYSGLINVNTITGAAPPYLESKETVDRMTDNEKLFYNLKRTDSLRIGYYDELKLLNPDVKRKRFVIWVYNLAMMNPTEYYFELYNKQANNNTPLDKFIKDSELSFFHFGTIIL